MYAVRVRRTDDVRRTVCRMFFGRSKEFCSLSMFVFINKSIVYLKYCECLKYCVVELGFTGLYSAESVNGIFVYIVFLL